MQERWNKGIRSLCTVHTLSGNKFSLDLCNLVCRHPCPFLNLQPFVDGLSLSVFRENVAEVEHGGVFAVRNWGQTSFIGKQFSIVSPELSGVIRCFLYF
jgi:hypothetical protein